MNKERKEKESLISEVHGSLLILIISLSGARILEIIII
jgi:hypothetical protein